MELISLETPTPATQQSRTACETVHDDSCTSSLTSVENEMVPPQDTLLALTQEQFTEPPRIVYDIGNIITSSTNSVNEICAKLRNLTSEQKYAFLFNHISPPHVLPSTFSHGCYRKFNVAWLTKYPWLKYS